MDDILDIGKEIGKTLVKTGVAIITSDEFRTAELAIIKGGLTAWASFTVKKALEEQEKTRKKGA